MTDRLTAMLVAVSLLLGGLVGWLTRDYLEAPPDDDELDNADDRREDETHE